MSGLDDILKKGVELQNMEWKKDLKQVCTQHTEMSGRVAAGDGALPLLDGRHPVQVPPHRRKLEVHHPVTVTYTSYDASGTIVVGRYQMYSGFERGMGNAA